MRLRLAISPIGIVHGKTLSEAACAKPLTRYRWKYDYAPD